MKHHQPRLQQRKNTKGEPGFWYYRKRIPADVLDVWTCGGTGKKEYVVSLRTRDERVARKRAALEHDKFLEILKFKRQEKRIRKSENQQRIDAHLRYEAYLKRMGAHPEQAPPAFDHDAVDRYREAVAVVKYGQIDGFTQSKFSGVEPRDQESFVDNGYGARVSQEFTDGLYHAQQDLGLDVSIDRDGNEKITRNQQYYEIQKDIDFLEGKSSRQYAYLPDIPTLADAKEAYLEHVNKKPRAEAKRASEVKRVERLVRDFAGQLGDGSTSDGLSRSLETIRVGDADRFVQSLRRTKSWSSVEREVSVMAALWNAAVRRFADTWPLERRRDNPFSGRGKELLDLHKRERLQGVVPDKRRRAFTKNELDEFVQERLPRMSEDLQLISMLALHVGCRLEDVTGLILNDCHLKVGNDRDIPYIHIRHNRLREVTKDGIERHIPLFGEVYERLVAYTHGRTGKDQPLFPRYGLVKGNGAGNASNAINKHIKVIRRGDVRLTFHSFRHTVQAKAMAADVDNKWAAYMGGWRNSDSLGLQRAYQKDGVPLPLLLKHILKIHGVSDWGADVQSDTDEWDTVR